MEYDVPYTSNSIMEALGLKSKETLRKNYINPAIELGVIRMTLPDKPNSKNQRYVKQQACGECVSYNAVKVDYHNPDG